MTTRIIFPHRIRNGGISPIKFRTFSLLSSISLSFSSIVNCPLLNIEEIHLKELVSDSYADVVERYAEKNPDFMVDDSGVSCSIQSDGVLIERIVKNLLENALKYSDEGVRIIVKLRNGETDFEISIEDTGWGIPKAAIKKLGRQFYRVEQKGKAQQPGYGIGLASVKFLCSMLGGELSVSSEEGKGSIFTVKLKNYRP